LTARYIKNGRLGVKKAFGSKGEDQHMLLPLMVLPYPFCGFKINNGETNFKEQGKEKAGNISQGPIPKISYGSRQHLLILFTLCWELKIIISSCPC
jgi:hypothetical protein